jgi:acetyltransferase-like isoleucine patch superfamily enzyme
MRIHRSRLGRLLQDLVRQPYVYGPLDRIVLGDDVRLMDATLNTMGGQITIGDHSFCGHNVSLLTGSHDIRLRGRARADAIMEGGDIVIGSGVWLASNVTVLGPCRIGDNAVVAAGSVVVEDVRSDTLVGGVPARTIRVIESADHRVERS